MLLHHQLLMRELLFHRLSLVRFFLSIFTLLIPRKVHTSLRLNLRGFFSFP